MSPGDKPPRPTLKLRAAIPAQRTERPAAAPAVRPAPGIERERPSPRADWSEVHKSKMQADMDLLASPQAQGTRKQ